MGFNDFLKKSIRKSGGECTAWCGYVTKDGFDAWNKKERGVTWMIELGEGRSKKRKKKEEEDLRSL